MTDNDGRADETTRPIRLEKDEPPSETQRIPIAPETGRIPRRPAPSTYYTPPGQYGSESAPPPRYGHNPPPQDAPQPPYPPPPYPPQGYGIPRPMAPPPAYNTAFVTTGRPAASGVVIAIAWILALVSFFYLLPWAVAATRNKSDQVGIFLINLLLGWSVIGWVVALVMACGSEPQSNVIVINQSATQHYYR